MNHRKNAWHEEQSRKSGKNQATDDRAAKRRILLAALAEPHGHRQHADDHGEGGHQHRADAHKSCFERGIQRVLTLIHLFTSEGHHQDAVCRGHTHAHDRTGQRRHVEGGVRQQQHPADAGQRARQRGNDNERIEPRLKIHHDQQIRKDNRTKQAKPKTSEGTLHRLDLSASDDVTAFWQFFLDILNALFHFVGDAAEVAAVNRGVDVDHGLRAVVRYLRRPRSRSGLHEIPKNLGRRTGRTAADRSVLQGLVSIHAILRLLHRDVVLHAILWIQPEGRRRLETGAERDEKVLRDVAGLHAHGLDARAVDFQEQRGVVKRLLHVHVHGARDVAELIGELFPDQIISALVHAGYFHVDGRGRAEIQNLRDDVRRLKEELHAREALRKFFAQIVDVRAGGLAAFLPQLDKNLRVGRSDGAGVAVGQVNAAVGQANVVQDGRDLVFGNRFADDSIDLIGKARGFLDAQAGARAHVQADLAGVDFWKEVAPEHADQQERENAETEKTGGEKLG